MKDIQLSDSLFQAPVLDQRELDVVSQIEEMRGQLHRQLVEPRRWFGSLRRLSQARAIQASNTIEGYTATLDEVAAVGDGDSPPNVDEETLGALRGYREAMTYVLQLATTTDFAWSDQLLKSLHFMMASYDLGSRPGLWREGPIYVHNAQTQEMVYEGPPAEAVSDLMHLLVNGLAESEELPAIVRGGMAHLNLVMIHPFKDGNGRMARCLQTLVIARDGVLAPQFCSVEEYLGANTPDYYSALAKVGGGSWDPARDARTWVRFTLTAHLRQAQTLLRRVRESESLWSALEDQRAAAALPERVLPGLFDAAMGLRVRNATYRISADISLAVAGRELKELAEKGLLVAHGEKRGRYYTASDALLATRAATRSQAVDDHTDDIFGP